jgi:hypothetical protein
MANGLVNPESEEKKFQMSLWIRRQSVSITDNDCVGLARKMFSRDSKI